MATDAPETIIEKDGPTATVVQTIPPAPTGEMSMPMQSAQELFQLAITNGAGVETLERLLDLRDRIMKEQAKQKFNEAMAAFQEECPMIEKTKNVEGKYKYAPIDSIVSQVKGVIRKHGFRYSTTMTLSESHVKVSVRVVHELGHEEISVMEVPIGDGNRLMSKPQIVAASTTFAKRYAFLNAFGIMTGDEDDDTAGQRKKRADDPVDVDPNTGEVVTRSMAQRPAAQSTTTKPPLPRKTADVPPSPAQLKMIRMRWDEFMRERKASPEDSAKNFVHVLQTKIGIATQDQLTKATASKLIDLIPQLRQQWLQSLASA